MGKKKTTEAEIPTTETPIETPAAPEVVTATEASAPEPKPRKPRKKKEAAITGVATLADLAAAYAVRMESDGKSAGTIASYGMELKLAQDELGAETVLSDLTPERVAEFFNSKRVTKLRSGKNKSQLSIDKTRRVLRLALVWAAERGIIAKAPIPEPVESK
jgi:hypothetical protein